MGRGLLEWGGSEGGPDSLREVVSLSCSAERLEHTGCFLVKEVRILRGVLYC